MNETTTTKTDPTPDATAMPQPVTDENGRWYYSAASLRASRQTKARFANKRMRREGLAAQTEAERLAEHLVHVQAVEAERIIARSTCGLWWQR